jgi:hypothetical protein
MEALLLALSFFGIQLHAKPGVYHTTIFANDSLLVAWAENPTA